MLASIARWIGGSKSYFDTTATASALPSADRAVVFLLALVILETCIVIPILMVRPPALLRLQEFLTQQRRKQQLRSLSRIKPKSKPLILLVNPKSGGRVGQLLIDRLKLVYKPELIFDMTASGGPAAAIGKFGANCRIMVAGGDGTVKWVLDTIDSLSLSSPPPVSVLPLGTGNDLSRTLNWGGGASASDIESDDFLKKHLTKVSNAKLKRIDRWNLTITSPSGVVSHTCVNYFSFGIDAQIALKFHNARNADPAAFTTRTGNLARYAMYGFEGSLEGTPLGPVALTVDGTSTNVSPLWKGVVVCNVPCYHGGSDFWGQSVDGATFTPPSCDDGVLEVMGLVGTLHIGMVHIGMDSAIRVAQGHVLEFSMEVPESGMCMQVDGEPWLQEKGMCTIKITRGKSGVVLLGPA